MFKQATELDPQNDRAWLGCARTADDWHATSEYARQALQINPENDEARGLYGATWQSGESAPAQPEREPPGQRRGKPPNRKRSPPIIVG